MNASATVEALTPVVEALERQHVDYRVGGSVASSALGVPRSTLDVDIVCEIDLGHVKAFVEALQGHYYVDEDMIRDAIRRGSSFNVIHLATMLKVDVFVAREGAYDELAFSRRTDVPLDAEGTGRSFHITTAEDIVLRKLQWFEMGARVSERQWNDALGVVRVQGTALDRKYLRRWAEELRLDGLLETLLGEADRE